MGSRRRREEDADRGGFRTDGHGPGRNSENRLPQTEARVLASELAYLADELAEIDIDKPEERAHLGELGYEIVTVANAVFELADESRPSADVGQGG